MTPTTGTFDDYATEYAAAVAEREAAGMDEPLGILPRLLDLLGDIDGAAVLDAGCGEGYLARALARQGARVTGIDISRRLIQRAREQNPDGAIDYRVADLSEPMPEFARYFDAIGSYLVINDVVDYRGFVATLAASLKPGGRVVVAMNNPYSFVVRRHITDYFETGGTHSYRGMAAKGIKVHFYHRTLEEYLDTFFAAGFRLTKLVDLPRIANNAYQDTLLLEGYRFPFLMILAFETTGAGG